MKKLVKLILFACLVTALPLLAGCGLVSQTVKGEEKDAVLAFSEAKTDNMLAGLKAGDYATFAADFDDQMRAALNEGGFASLKAGRDEAVGAYISREVSTITLKDGFYTVFYLAQFEKQADVIMRVVFREEEPHQISGLWFNK